MALAHVCPSCTVMATYQIHCLHVELHVHMMTQGALSGRPPSTWRS